MTLPTLIFEVGFTTDPSTGMYLHLDDAARGILDTNTLAPADVVTDVSSFVHGFSTTRSSNRVAGPVLRFEAGSLSADLNNTDRRFDPTNLTGPYVAGGVSQVTPMRLVRVRAAWGSSSYNVWRGYADSWLPGYIKGDSYSSVDLEATDGFKVLGNNTRAPVGAVGAGELSGARISRILDSADWPTLDRVIEAGRTTLQSTTLEGDALAETQLVSDTEIGSFYIDAAGRATFLDRFSVFNDTRSNTSQAIFGDDLSTELPYVGIQPSYDDEQMINRTLTTRVGGTQQVWEDAVSKQQYLIHAEGGERSDLIMQDDTVARDYGQYIVYISKDPEYRFESLTINPLADPTDLFPQVLGREIGDRITVRRRPPGGGLIERDVLIVGISHDVDFRSGTWMTTWQLSSTSKLAFLILDHATLGKLDQNALAF